MNILKWWKRFSWNGSDKESQNDKDGGWTFIETLIVLGIVLTLTATVGFSAARYLNKAKLVAARSQLDSFDLALQSYFLDCGIYPTESQGLDALWERPNVHPVPEQWDGPYLSKKPAKDPWGFDYVYIIPGSGGLPYGIASYGADGMQGGTGDNKDVVSWE